MMERKGELKTVKNRGKYNQISKDSESCSKTRRKDTHKREGRFEKYGERALTFCPTEGWGGKTE